MKRFKVLLIILFILIIIIVSYLFFNPEIKVYCNNKIIKSNYNFIYEHWKEKRLYELYGREDYKSIKAKSEFEYFLKLAEWVNFQWKSSTPNPYPLSNAISILDDIRSGKTGGFCGQYAYVYADVLKSLGFFAVRYVELWSNKGESHFSVEVWSNEYKKWVMIDPHQGLYYVLKSDNKPANAYEIRRSLNEADFKVIEKPIVKDFKIKHYVKKRVYQNFAVSLRSDLMRHTKPLTIGDRFDMFLFYKDKYTNASAFKTFGNKIPYRNITTRLEDLYYECNRVRVEYEIIDNKIYFQFFTDSQTPNFKSFAVSFDKGKIWKYSNSKIEIPIPKENKTFYVKTINMLNRSGPIEIVFIHVYY